MWVFMTMITPQNVFRHELIGLTIEVIDSNHVGNVGIKGKIIDETRDTFVVECGDHEKRLIKDQIKFYVYLPDDRIVLIDGKYIVARPEDRIKKKFNKIR